MSGSKVKTVYWDSCVYITWLSGDIPKEGNNVLSLPAIQKLIERNETHDIIIATSQITLIEVLSGNKDPDVERSFQSVFKTPYNIRYDVDPKVSAKARAIREHFLKQDPPINVRTPDAIHLATAILLEVDEFHTFDRGKKDNGKKCDLISLDGNTFLNNLKISVPKIAEPEPAPLKVVDAEPAPPELNLIFGADPAAEEEEKEA